MAFPLWYLLQFDCPIYKLTPHCLRDLRDNELFTKNDLNRNFNATARQTGLKVKREKGILIFGLLYSHFSSYYPDEKTKGLVIISSDNIILSFSKPFCQCPSLPVT